MLRRPANAKFLSNNERNFAFSRNSSQPLVRARDIRFGRGQCLLERLARRLAAYREHHPAKPAAGLEVLAHLLDLDPRRLGQGEPADARSKRDQRQGLAPSWSARRRVLAVARRMISADVGPPSSIVAAWITHRHGIEPPEVSTASPSPIGARSRLS